MGNRPKTDQGAVSFVGHLGKLPQQHNTSHQTRDSHCPIHHKCPHIRLQWMHHCIGIDVGLRWGSQATVPRHLTAMVMLMGLLMLTHQAMV
mmetsp:Transcript_61110/g.100994  ORF Transcript_61110/g.100994 Transcript_61110/m.100994 type:complete len:91 (-) Transcript_61110:147-419(-)